MILNYIFQLIHIEPVVLPQFRLESEAGLFGRSFALYRSATNVSPCLGRNVFPAQMFIAGPFEIATSVSSRAMQAAANSRTVCTCVSNPSAERLISNEGDCRGAILRFSFLWSNYAAALKSVGEQFYSKLPPTDSGGEMNRTPSATARQQSAN